MAILNSELQDLILEQINNLNKPVEILLRQTPATAPVSSHQGSDDDAAVLSDNSHQQGTGNKEVATPVSDLENVSTTTSTSLLHSICDISTISNIPVVCASPVVASNTIPTSLTVPLIGSLASRTSLTVPLFESAVSHISHNSIT